MLPNPDEHMLTILHTNDIHSHFEAMEHIAAMIEDERTKAGHDVLLLDVGDHMDRMALETEGTMGQANVDVLNLTGYDAVTIGNNEGLTFTPELLEQAYVGLACPIVCCNIREHTTGLTPTWMKEDVILHKGKLTIGITGATAPYDNFYSLLGWDSLQPIPEIAKRVERLRSQVDFVIVLSHLGLPIDRDMAAEIPGIDLILGGHTHHLLEEPLYIGNTAIMAAEKFGHYLGKVVVRKDPVTGRTSIVSGECISVHQGPNDIHITKAIAIHRAHAAERMQRTVAITEVDLPIYYDRESPFGNILAQAVRTFTESDISLVNSGQMLDSLPAGQISEGMLHARCPSPINACRMRLRGEDVLYCLEQSLIREHTERVIYGFGFRGKVLGGLCVDGIEIEFDLSRDPYNRVVQAMILGAPIERTKEYVVGTLDMFTFGIGYERLKTGTDKQFMLPEFIRDLLRFELQTPSGIEHSFQKRWKMKSG